MRGTAKVALCGAAWVLASVVGLSAQISTGAVTGTVTDSGGGVLPGVTVSLSGDRLIGGSQTQVTDATGVYRFDRLPPGAYSLKLELQGFKSVERPGVHVDAAFTATVNVQMGIGQVAETVTVTGESPTVDTTSTLQQTVMGQDVLEKVPSGRDPWSLSKLIPGVQVATYDVGGTQSIQQSNMSVHGSTTGDVVYAIDGMNTNWPGGGGGATSSYYDQGMFEQINFATSAIPAEQAVGGVFVNMVTKEGGNHIRGSVGTFFANDQLQSDNFNTPELQRFKFNSGNPVSKLYDLDASVGGPFVPDRLWWFVAHRTFRLNRLTLGAKNPDGTPALDDNIQQTWTGKATWQATSNQKLDYLWSVNFNNRYHRRDPPLLLVTDQASTRAVARHVTTGPHYTAVLSKRIVFESALMARLGVGSFGYQPDTLPTDLRIEDPVLNTATGAAPGWQYRPNGRVQFNNTVSFDVPQWHGSHTFKTGVQFARQSFSTKDLHNGDLTLIYNDGVPNSVRIYNTPTQADSYTNQLGVFLQDDWRLGPHVTLNLGGRVDFDKGWNAAEDEPAGRFVPARHFDEQTVVSQHIAVWRSGLVYDVAGDGRTAVKLNYSRYGAQVGIDRVTTVSSAVNSTGVRSWADLNHDGIPQDNELGPFSGFSGGVNSRYASADGPRWPYSDEITAGVERQVSGDIRVGVMYYHRTNREQVGFRNVAVPSSAYTAQTVTVPGNTTGPGGTATFYNLSRSYLGLQNNVYDNQPLLDTNYNGLELTASKRLSHRWQLTSGLTIGKTLGGLNTGDLNDPNNLVNQQGVVGNDSTYSLKVSGSYAAPGGVTLSGSILRSMGTGTSLTYTVTRAVFPSLTRANQSILLSESGQERYPDVTLVDLRVSRPFSLGGGVKLEPLLEVFNLGNASTIVTLINTVGSRYLTPTQILGPRLVRIGVRLQF